MRIKKRGLGKAGLGHFEMIISFVFFVGFVFFLFTILKPYNTSTLPDAVVSRLYDSFDKAVSTNLTSIFLKANYTGEDKCFSVQLPKGIFKYAFSESLLKDISGNPVDSSLDGSGNLNINPHGIFYEVEISPEFNNSVLSGCTSLKNYQWGSLLERRVVSYNSLKNMKIKYENNYTGLKSDLEVPPTFDFAIDSEDLPEIDMNRSIPDVGNVIAKEYILGVLNSDGDVSNARFTLKVW